MVGFQAQGLLYRLHFQPLLGVQVCSPWCQQQSCSGVCRSRPCFMHTCPPSTRAGPFPESSTHRVLRQNRPHGGNGAAPARASASLFNHLCPFSSPKPDNSYFKKATSPASGDGPDAIGFALPLRAGHGQRWCRSSHGAVWSQEPSVRRLLPAEVPFFLSQAASAVSSGRIVCDLEEGAAELESG